MATLDPTFVETPADRLPHDRSFRDLARRVRGIGAASLGDLATGAIVALAYLLRQSDEGIQGDAHIYLGRALADHDPGGIGRDLMFVHDGQSAFSVFGIAARFGVGHLGLAATAQLSQVAAVLAWAGAMLALVAALRPGRHLAVVAAAALLLPRWYTPWSGMEAGEAAAVARPFAEAAVLVALALLARGRPLGCGLSLCVAAALHPIMAAPGFGVLACVMIGEDRRWAIAAAGLAALALVACAVGVPVLDRAAVALDPAWLAILRERSPYLFVTTWPADALAMVGLQLVTILVAATLVSAPFARVLHAVVAVALLGGLTSAIGCDWFHLVLFAQAQLWRSVWLGAAVAPLAAGVCVWRLPELGPRGRLALACLAAAWACVQLQPIGILFALSAAALVATRRAGATDAFRLAVSMLAGAAVASGIAATAAFGPRAGIDARAGSLAFVWHLTIWPALVVTFAATAAHHRGGRLAVAAWVAVPVLLLALVWGYDDRSALKADRDAARLRPDLVALLASRPGEVLWLGGDELWYWTRRPNWNASLQGAGLVFSRDLALTWRDRAAALVGHGLASARYISPWAEAAEPRPLAYDRPRIDDLCRRTDAPAWVVLPVSGGAPAKLDADVRVWTTSLEPSRVRLVIPCRDMALAAGGAR